MKYIPLFLIVLLSCKSQQKANNEKNKTDDDKVVMRPPEGYGRPEFQRSAHYVDSMRVEQQKAAGKPQPCSVATGLTQVGLTSFSVSFQWTGASGKYFVYRNGFYDGTATSNYYTSTGLTPSTTYSFTVALVGKGNKTCPMSNPLVIITSLPPQPPPTGGTIPNVVYLNFGAVTVSGTSWNGNGDIVSPGSGMTDDEQLTAFNTVKNMYTGHPKIRFTMDRAVFDSADTKYRAMCIFTTNYQWYGQAGGVAYVGSFNTDTPCWVFTSLLNYNTRNIGDAGGHEVGHTLGCYHAQDTCLGGYAPSGTLCNDGVWRTKIMGADYSDYQHIFQTPLRCAGWGIKCIQAGTSPCPSPDEDAAIERHLK